MAETPKVYAVCGKNCFYETLTREQILTAIAQAVETGEIGDIDAGFVQTIKTINGVPLKFFVGTQSLYDTLSEEDKQNLFALITDDTSSEELMEYLNGLAGRVSDLETKAALSHAATAGRADYATKAGTATTATKATRMASLAAGTDNTYRYVWFSDVDEPTLPRRDTDFKYNPYTNTLKVKKLDTTSTAKCVVSDAISLTHGEITITGASLPEGKTLDDLVFVGVGAAKTSASALGVVGYGVPVDMDSWKFRFSVETPSSRLQYEAEFTSDDTDAISMTIGGADNVSTWRWYVNSDGTVGSEVINTWTLLTPFDKVYLTFYFK